MADGMTTDVYRRIFVLLLIFFDLEYCISVFCIFWALNVDCFSVSLHIKPLNWNGESVSFFPAVKLFLFKLFLLKSVNEHVWKFVTGACYDIERRSNFPCTSGYKSSGRTQHSNYSCYAAFDLMISYILCAESKQLCLVETISFSSIIKLNYSGSATRVGAMTSCDQNYSFITMVKSTAISVVTVQSLFAVKC